MRHPIAPQSFVSAIRDAEARISMIRTPWANDTTKDSKANRAVPIGDRLPVARCCLIRLSHALR